MAYTNLTFVPGEILTAAKMNLLAANDAGFHDGTGLGDNTIQLSKLDANLDWVDYNPVGTGINASSYIGRYRQVDKTVSVFVRINVTSLSGNYIIVKLPKPVKGGGLGTCFPVSLNDGGSSYRNYQGMANLVSSGGSNLRLLTKYNESVDSSKPFGWTSGDSINLTAAYETV